MRIENADREARLNVLKQKSKQRLLESGIVETETLETTETPSEHINLFENFDHAIKTTNKDHDNEVKEKKEEYEKKIGYLTYLGQDTNEALKKKNWYEVLPEESRFSRTSSIKDTYDKLVLKDHDGKAKPKEIDEKNGEIAWKAKQRLDPLNTFRKYCPVTKKEDIKVKAKPTNEHSKITDYKSMDKTKKKKHKKDNADKNLKLQKLREARLKREMQEKHKTEMFLTGLNGTSTSTSQEQPVNKVKPKYNSQFNPELARQNYR